MANLFKAVKKIGRFAKSGFLGHDGKVAYLSEEVLEEAIQRAIGIPILLEHDDQGKVYGYVSNVYRDGDWYNAEMVIHDENMAKVLSQADSGGFKTSTGFYIKSGREGKFLRNDVPYQVDIGSIDWKEWTLTRTPKYQDAVILNSAQGNQEVNFCEDFINEQAKENACEDDKTEEVKNHSEEEANMSKVTIQGKEFEESYVMNAIENFEKGSNGIVSTLMSVFNKSNAEVLNQSQEDEKPEEKPAEEEVKNESEEKKDVQENSESEKSEEEVKNSEEEKKAESDDKEDEKVSEDEVKNESEKSEEKAESEEKKTETKTAEEVKNSMTTPVSAKQINFDFAQRKY